MKKEGKEKDKIINIDLRKSICYGYNCKKIPTNVVVEFDKETNELAIRFLCDEHFKRYGYER